MAQVDTVIRGGEIANATDSAVADVGIQAGVVVQIGGELEGATEIDARGKLLLPGGVDAHVHFTPSPTQRSEPRWVDDFTSGGAAAVAGGVTTVGNMTYVRLDETPLEVLAQNGALAARQTIADAFLHPVLVEIASRTMEQIPRLLEHGCNSIKYYMTFPAFDQQTPEYVEATRLAGEHGLITLIHCEDRALVQDATNRLVAAGQTAIRFYPDSRPVISEVVATQRAVAIAEATGAPVYVVHLSCARALAVCAEAQSRGVPVYVETRPLYLHLTRERFEEERAGCYVGQPPLREAADVAALWAGIQQGTLHTVCTDHAPWSLEAKLDPAHTIDNLRPGTENLQTMLPMLYSEGVRTGRISLSRFVQVTSTNVAKLFGLYPRKGTIAVGSDADIVVFDPELTRTVDRAMIKSNAGHSPFEGWTVTGWPVATLRRGELVYRDDNVLAAAGSGQLVRRGPTQAL